MTRVSEAAKTTKRSAAVVEFGDNLTDGTALPACSPARAAGAADLLIERPVSNLAADLGDGGADPLDLLERGPQRFPPGLLGDAHAVAHLVGSADLGRHDRRQLPSLTPTQRGRY